MEWQRVDTVSFTAVDGKSYSVRLRKDIEEYPTKYIYEKKLYEQLDQIASETNVQGAFGELATYKIFDHNVVSILEYHFDITKIKEVKIPL